MNNEIYNNKDLKSLPNEIWEDILDYEGLYQVSSLGRIKSLERECNFSNNSKRKIKEMILSQIPNHNGYLSVTLSKNGKLKRKPVHIYVATAFLGYEKGMHEQGFVIDHKYNVRTDNRCENLQIITKRENVSKDTVASSKYTGVVKKRNSNKYISQITINGKLIYLGTFDCEKEASDFYNRALISYNNNLNIERKIRTKKSKYKGVYAYKNKWYAQIVVNGKRKSIGYFNTEIEAKNSINNYKH